MKTTISASPIRKRLANFVWSVMRTFSMGPLLLRFHPKSGLLKLGWFESFRKKKSVDKKGNPLPWWTYSFIFFLENRLSKDIGVLEFGSGSSTLWLSQYVGRLLSLEDDERWAKTVQKQLSKNCNLILVESYEKYIDEIIDKNQLFDLVIIDAGRRIEIGKKIFPCLSQKGVVVWDNTDGPDWPEIQDLFLDRGFSELSFTGLTPQEVALSRTTLFYRKMDNCIGL